MKKAQRDAEDAYRRGFSHGFQMAITKKPESWPDWAEKIRKWRASNKNVGAPGTIFDGEEMYEYTSEYEF